MPRCWPGSIHESSIPGDENIDPDLVLGLRRRLPDVDIVRVQEVGLRTLDDPTILQWAAEHGRILVSRDIKTIPGFANERILAGRAMPGVVIIPAKVSMAIAIDDLEIIAGATEAHEWVNRIAYLPLR